MASRPGHMHAWSLNSPSNPRFSINTSITIDIPLTPSTPNSPASPLTPSTLASYRPLLNEGQSSSNYQAKWSSLFLFTNKDQYPLLGGCILLSFLSAFILPGMSIILGRIFTSFSSFSSNSITSAEFLSQVRGNVFILITLGVLSWLINGAFFSTWLYFGELQALSARKRVFDALLIKDVSWFMENKTDALLSRCSTQIKELQTATSHPLAFLSQSLLTALIAISVALYYSWSLTLLILSIIPPGFFVLSLLSRHIPPLMASQKSHLSSSTTLAASSITSITTIKTHSTQEFSSHKYTQSAQKSAKEYFTQAHLSALQLAFVRFLVLGLFVAGFWFGSYLVATKKSTPGAVVTAFWSVFMASQALETVMPQLLGLERGKQAAADLRGVITSREGRSRSRKSIAENPGLQRPEECQGGVELKGVGFRYPDRDTERVLKGVDMVFPVGRMTYVIGRSGAGKSTVGALIAGVLRPSEGQVFIDGFCGRTLDPEWWRENVSLVMQQGTLFDETVGGNIAFGRGAGYLEVNEQEIVEAVRVAGLGRDISEFPKGLQTKVGRGGKELSGGQLQRVALARDRIKDAPIVILDETLSSLDIVTRRKISAEIRQWRKGKTTIIITHDINEIELHDYLYILESGAIVQKGFRRDLEFRSGPFQNFLLNISTSKTFPDNRRASRPIPLNIIPELNTEFWNKSNSDLTISPSFCSTGSVYSNSTTYFTEADRRAFSVNSPSRDGFQKASVSGFSPQSSPNRPTARRPGLLRPEWNLGRMQRSISDRSPLSAFIPVSRTPSPQPSEITDSTTLTPILSTFGWGSSDLGTSDVSTVAVTSSSDSDLEKDAMLPKPSEERKQTLLEILGTVWPSLKPKGRVMLVFGFLSALLHAAATPVFSFCLAQLLGVILNTNLPLSTAQKWSLIILAIAVVDTVNCYILHYFLARIGQEWAHIQRTRAFGKILLQPLAWFLEKGNGVSELTEDLEKHAEEMRNMVAKVAGYGFIGAFLVVIGMAWSVACNWKLTLVGLSVGPVMAAISKGMTKASDGYEKRCNDSAQEMGGVVHEAIAAIQTVKNYSLEKYFRKQYAAAAKEGLRTGKKRCFWTGIWFGLADSAILFSTALIFYFGATFVKNHENMKDVISVFTLLLFSISSANAIINLVPQVSSIKDSAHRVLRLADLPEKSHETTGSKSPSAGDIVFTKVRFSYPDRPVLDDVSFTIKANTMVAITGASGCGKSTIVALLQRMYANTCNITLGDSLINQLSTRMLRDHMVVVPQTPAIFDDSIIQNITYGISVWKYLAVEQAAKAAGIHEFVMSLPEGYNANATGLSAGQKRRVAIARALLRKPQVLVLDEGTVGLDVHSAEHIRKTLVKLKEEMTVVVVTHDEELMFVADKVVVIGRGKVEEEGTYQDLIAKIGPGALKALLKGNRA